MMNPTRRARLIALVTIARMMDGAVAAGDVEKLSTPTDTRGREQPRPKPTGRHGKRRKQADD